MIITGPGMFAEADHHHLHEPAFDRPVIAGVRLDARDDADVIRLRRDLIEHDRKAFAGRAERHGFHRGANWGADEGLGDAVAFQNLALPLGEAAAVAAHGGYQKRLGAQVLQKLHSALEDDRDIGDAAAARRERHRLPGPDRLAEIEWFEGMPHRHTDVGYTRAVEVLFEP